MRTLSNLLSKLKNGFLSKKTKIIDHNTNKSIIILNILVKEGFIKNYKVKSNNEIEIFLKYKNNKSVINNIILISKSSKRIYIKNKDLFFKIKGIYLISTSLGIVTNLEAKKLNIGGELICQIY